MSVKPDFESYSLDELYSSYRGIDKDRWPERVEEIKKLILEKEAALPKRDYSYNPVGSLAERGDRIIAWLIDPAFIFGNNRRCLHDYMAGTKVSYVGS